MGCYYFINLLRLKFITGSFWKLLLNDLTVGKDV